MKLVRIAAGVAAIGAVGVLAGCPLNGLPGSNSPTPGPTAPAGSLVGRFTFQGGNPPQTLTAQYNPVTNGTRGARASATATTDSQGNFFFPNISSGQYQIIWDDGGQTMTTASDNTMGLFVSAPVTAPNNSSPVTMDLYWTPNPNPAPNATLTPSTTQQFTFNPVPNLAVYYQISLFNSSKQALTPTATGSSPLTVDTSSLSTGANYFYQIKFFANGAPADESQANMFGSTKYIPFKM